MSTIAITAFSLMFFIGLAFSVPSNSQRQGAPTSKDHAIAAAVERRIRLAWESYQKKDRRALDDISTEDSIAVETDGKGPRGKKVTLSEMDAVTEFKYSLSDLKVQPLGPKSALATYTASIEGRTTAEQAFRARFSVGEVWVKQQDGVWRSLYFQSTELK